MLEYENALLEEEQSRGKQLKEADLFNNDSWTKYNLHESVIQIFFKPAEKENFFLAQFLHFHQRCCYL